MAYAEYVGRAETREDRIDERLVEGLAATLGRPLPEGDLPPLWHWMLFQDWRSPEGLGPDGHPKRGGFLPPVHDLPRRMWAGGRLQFATPLRAGETARRTSTILKVDEKSGGSGRLVFVTVRHEIAGPRGHVLTEEHDIVYRGTEGAAVRAAEAAPDLPNAFTAALTPDPVLLFRYSALTGNGHRIHYDFPYVTQEEGYPGLVVHGPLQATLLAQHLLDHAPPGARIATFRFRGRRPCFAGRKLRLVGTLETPGSGGEARLETRDEDGATCMQAEATLA
ncbi:MaoC family dehydratase N-terminal domain-containing protein [Roseomonas sp. NAR14]|uniref:MaoC family dehydratase N-terminal domain-containing protein n=1 Tax=Roseomonas acroporae TaxID=2937791 RepID=A0A9X1YA51_9PROT|nr:MaoC family dehydratase N-terminal domain-containing protein [Roseomonas acroporae]MCK8785905.1 MaoC family dehydratase N-terminal domain-containing protein [Roseomonas acroporae]